MTPEDISHALNQQFGQVVAQIAPGSWQVETSEFRLLVLLSDDLSWLRMLMPIAPLPEALPFVEQLMEANFDATQETRYAFHQNVLWGVFQHSCAELSDSDFGAAVQRLLLLKQQGLDDSFNQFAEERIRQIVQAAKQQGQSLELTLQTLDRFYEEGLLGEMGAGAGVREETLAAWRYQLERLWDQV
jgi:hypothetical protein